MHYSLLTSHYSLLTTLCSLLATHYSLPTTHYSLLTTHYSLPQVSASEGGTPSISILSEQVTALRPPSPPTCLLCMAHCSLLTTRLLLTTHFSLLTSHFSLLTSHYSLPQALASEGGTPYIPTLSEQVRALRPPSPPTFLLCMAHCSLLTTYYALTTLYSLLTSHYPQACNRFTSGGARVGR